MQFINTADMNIPGGVGAFYSWGLFFTTFISFALGILTIAKKRDRQNTYWALTCLAICVWAGSLFIWSRATTYETAYLFNVIANIVGILIATFLFEFCQSYTNIKKKSWTIANYSIGLSILLAALIIPSQYIQSLSPKTIFKMYPSGGITYFIFFLYFGAIELLVFYRLIQFLKKSSPAIKRQIKIILSGLIISFVGGTMNFLPIFEINIFPFGSSFTGIFAICTTYAIIRYKAFDIETIIHKTLLWIVLSTITIVPLGFIIHALFPILKEMKQIQIISIVVILFLLTHLFYNKIRPVIDHIFQRRKYDYRKILDAFFDKISTLKTNAELFNIAKENIRNTLYPNEITCYIFNNQSLNPENTSKQKMSINKQAEKLLASLTRPIEKPLIDITQYSSKEKKILKDICQKSEAEILLPIKHNQVLYGTISLSKKQNLKSYTNLDIKFLHDLTRELSIAFANSAMYETTQQQAQTLKELNLNLEKKVEERTEDLRKTRDALWGEMQLAKKIQTVLVPDKPQATGYEIAASMATADEVGGDYYDVVNTDGTNWFVIGDVSGHGVPAGLIMMMVQTALRVTLEQTPDLEPSKLLEIVNKTIYSNIKKLGENKYMTITAFASLKPGQITFAGLHQDILIYRNKTQSIEEIETNGMWIGVVDDLKNMVQDESLSLEKDDVMFVYTDGLTEAVLNGEMYGEEKLRDTFIELAPHPAEKIKEGLMKSLEPYSIKDDITMMVIRKE